MLEENREEFPQESTSEMPEEPREGTQEQSFQEQQFQGESFHQQQNYGMPMYQNPDVCKKKPKGMKVWVSTLLLGLLAGGTFGGAFWGVNTGANYLLEKYTDSEDRENREVDPVTTYTSTGSTVNNSLSTVIDSAMPSIVSMNVTQEISMDSYYQYFGYPESYEAEGSGSGVIIGQSDKELMILTNNHVVADADSLSVSFIDGTSVEGVVKGTNADADLAIVSIPLSSIPSSTLESIKVATIGNSEELKVGDQVIAIGNALGYGQSATVGYVSALNKEIQEDDGTIMTGLIQTDAAINPGNSGGALLNSNGELIGINVAKLADTTIEGIGFAIPITESDAIIQDLMQQETRYEVPEEERGYLQISANEVDASVAEIYGFPKGIHVREMEEDGPAAQAGIEVGDIITQLNGVDTPNMDTFQTELSYYRIGDTVTITVAQRANGYEEVELEVTLDEQVE